MPPPVTGGSVAVPGCRKPQNGPSSVVRARGAGRPCVVRRDDGGKPREGKGAVVATQARLLSRRLVRVNYTPNGGGSLRCRPFARPRRPVEAARQRPLSLPSSSRGRRPRRSSAFLRVTWRITENALAAGNSPQHLGRDRGGHADIFS